MSLEYYTKNLIKLGDGKLAAKYVACVSEDLIDHDWHSEPSILKKHIKTDERNTQEFKGTAARILGWWASERHFTLHFNQFALPELDSELLSEKPDKLGRPIFLDSDSQEGGKLWLLESYITPFPLKIP